MDPHKRLTVIENIYYQLPEEDPTEHGNTYALHFESGEQVFSRKTKVSQERSKVDVGWVEKTICLRIKNIEALSTQKNSSQEEKEEVAKHVLEVFTGKHTEGLLLTPGESLRIRPRNVTDLEIQSLYGSTKYEVIVFSE